MTQNTSASHSEGKNVLMAMLAYLGILILIPLLTEAKNDSFVKFHIKQGVILLVFFAVGFLLNIIPLLGLLIHFVWILVGILFALTGVMNAIAGRERPLPLIGGYADNFKI